MDWFRRKSLAKETLSSLQSVPVEPSPVASRQVAASPTVLTTATSAGQEESNTQPTILVHDSESLTRGAATPTVDSGTARPTSATLGSSGTSRTENYDARLKVHSGVVDQSALTSRPVPEVLADVLRVLRSMGIDVKRESDFRLRCTRARRRKSGATTGLGLSSVMSKGSTAGDFQASASSSSVRDKHRHTLTNRSTAEDYRCPHRLQVCLRPPEKG